MTDDETLEASLVERESDATAYDRLAPDPATANVVGRAEGGEVWARNPWTIATYVVIGFLAIVSASTGNSLDGAFSIFFPLLLVVTFCGLPLLKRRLLALGASVRTLTGESSVELRSEPQSCIARVFGHSPAWNRLTSYMEHETDAELVTIWSTMRSNDLSVADISLCVYYCALLLLTLGTTYSTFWGAKAARRVWLATLLFFALGFELFEHVILVLMCIQRLVKLKRNNQRQAGVGEL